MRILAVDYLGCLYAHHHAKDPQPTWQFLKQLRDIMAQFKIDRTLLLLEGGSRYREALHPGYKEARKKRRAEQTDDEKRRYKSFIKDADHFAQNVAPLFGIVPVRVFGAEADDLAGYLCNHVDLTQHQIMNLSGDQDWYQLLRKNVVQASYAKILECKEDRIPARLWLTRSTFEKEYQIPVDQWIWKKCLSGDVGDSVPGFAWLGEGTALQLLQQYGGIDGIKANKDTVHVPYMKTAAKKDLAANFDRVYFNYQLMNLNHAPEVEQEIFGTDGRALLDYVINTVDVPCRVDVDALIELSYSNGWLEIDRQWLYPFLPSPMRL